MLQLRNVKLNFENVSARGKKILFVSDIHVVSLSQMGEERELNYERERQKIFEKESELPTLERLKDVVAYVNSEDIDLLILGGDIIDCPSESNMKLLAEQLGKLTKPYIYVTGNHDWNYSWDYLSKASREKYLTALSEVTGCAVEAELLNREGVQILALNSSENRIYPSALKLLHEIRENNKPCLIVMHVPFSTADLRKISMKNWNFETTMGDGGLDMDSETERFYRDLEFCPSAVILGGHVHGFDDNYLTCGVRQIVAPAGCRGEAVLIEI